MDSALRGVPLAVDQDQPRQLAVRPQALTARVRVTCSDFTEGLEADDLGVNCVTLRMVIVGIHRQP